MQPASAPTSPPDIATEQALKAVRRVLCAALPLIRPISAQLYGDLRRALRSTEQALRTPPPGQDGEG